MPDVDGHLLGTGLAGRVTGRPLRVLVVDERLYVDGATQLVLSLAQRWSEAGTAVVFSLLKPPTPTQPGPPVPPAVRLQYPARRRTGGGLPRQVLRLARALVGLLHPARGADVVLAAREIGLGLILSRVAAMLVRTPFVVLVQSDPHQASAHHVRPRLRPLVRWCLRSADRVVCVSPGLVPALTAMGVPVGRVTVVPNGVDVGAVVAASARPALQLPDGDGPLVVGLGRLVRQKGFDLLIRAHARVVADGVPHRLLVLGEGSQREELLRLADELGVAGSLSMPGHSHDPLPVLAAADLYCLPSRWEGFGLALAEALVVGTPVVAADCVSGPRWLLADGEHGDLVPVEDVEGLAAAMHRHLQDPDRLRAAAARGQRWARTTLDDQSSSARFLDVLRATAR